jgi:hypothetical protein
MSDAPERVWIAEDEIGNPWWTIGRDDDMDEYVRADLFEAAVRRALEAAAGEAAKIRAVEMMLRDLYDAGEGRARHDLAQASARDCVMAIRAIAADPAAVRRIVEGEE